MTSILLSLLMGAILGFSAHRAGLCMVKAAAEILTSGRGYFLWSFVKSATRVMALTAVIGALGVSSVQRGSFKLHLPPVGSALRHGAGGLLMGAGTVLVPGGNDGLILFAMPALSPHAIPAYAGIFAGILATISIMRVFGSQIPPVTCSGDICRTR